MSFGITKMNRKSMLSLAICMLAFAELISAHSYFSSITVDGTAYKEGECMRAHPGSQYDYPISSLDRPNGLSSADMTCGWLPAAGKAATKRCPVNPGSTVTLQWHYEMGLSSDTFIIDPSHKGPCIVYMAKAESNGAGNVWFKIFEDGYDTVSKSFCVTRMRANGGKFSVKIPTDIAPGNYILRGELIALHEGDRLNGAQPYVGCAEVTVGGSGTVNPAGVAIPGAYSPNDPGINFDIYSGRITSYPVPGPRVYVSGSSTPVPTPTPNPAPATTAAVVRATTGRTQSSTSTSSGRATTGRSSTSSGRSTTGRTQSSSTSTSTSSSSGATQTGCSVAGYMKCATSETYQTCAPQQGGALGWAAPQSCQSGLTCHPSGNYIYCY